MSNLFTLDYWFKLQPEPLSPPAWQAFIACLIFLATASIVTAFLKMRPGLYRGFFKRLYGFSLGNILIGLFLLFFNYETVPFFSARFWLGLWGLVMIAWLIFMFREAKAIPQKKKELSERQIRDKYLP